MPTPLSLHLYYLILIDTPFSNLFFLLIQAPFIHPLIHPLANAFNTLIIKGFLTTEPVKPVFTTFATVTLPTCWDKVIYNCITTSMTWLYMIQRICWYSTISADTIPGIKDLLPKSLLCIALAYKP